MTTLENFGVHTKAHIDQTGQVVVDFTTDRAMLVRVNGQVLTQHGQQAKAPPRQTFWNPDGTQNNVGTVDLRGEVR